jgi:sugar lactone lactonase YvrE
MVIDFRPLTALRCELGESPVYDDRRHALWLCDIVNRTIHAIDLATETTQSWSMATEVGSLGLAESGNLVVALRHEVGLFDPDHGTFRRIAEIEADRGHDTRLNDGKVGPDGAFWVGSMDDRGLKTSEPIGAMYRVDGAGRVERKFEGLKTSNGLAFSPDGRTMFHSDSRGPWIDRWSFDARTGFIAHRHRLADLDEPTGQPDGGACDAEGCYWSAGISAQRLNRFASDGRLMEHHAVPVGAPTMPCFGGPDLRTVFVTSLRVGRPAELLERFPLTGMVMVGRSAVPGGPVSRFRDT